MTRQGWPSVRARGAGRRPVWSRVRWPTTDRAVRSRPILPAIAVLAVVLAGLDPVGLSASGAPRETPAGLEGDHRLQEASGGEAVTGEVERVAPGSDRAAPRDAPAGDGAAREPAAQDAPRRSGAELDALTARVAAQLRCPVCRNQSVLESSATLAREMQSIIREKLAAGESPDEVRAYFVSRYGEWVLLKPPARGLNLLVWVLPFLGLLAGGVLVWRLLRRWTARSPAPSEAAADAVPTANGRTEGAADGPPGTTPDGTKDPARDAAAPRPDAAAPKGSAAPDAATATGTLSGPSGGAPPRDPPPLSPEEEERLRRALEEART